MSEHRARKRFGQNFLHDPRVLQRIVQAIDPQPADHVVEIGPGTGALTEYLLRRGAQVTAIELDRDLIPRLRARFATSDHLTLLEGDALEVDFRALAARGPIRAVGNLPYNIATPIIFRLLELEGDVQDMHFMVQREVADRLAAAVNTEAYGRLAIMAQYRCHVTRLFTIGPGAFQPPPKVHSALVHLVPDFALPRARDERLFAELVRAAFAARRKTLRNALRGFASPDSLEQIGIDPAARPAELSREDYIRLANRIAGEFGMDLD